MPPSRTEPSAKTKSPDYKKPRGRPRKVPRPNRHFENMLLQPDIKVLERRPATCSSLAGSPELELDFSGDPVASPGLSATLSPDNERQPLLTSESGAARVPSHVNPRRSVVEPQSARANTIGLLIAPTVPRARTRSLPSSFPYDSSPGLYSADASTDDSTSSYTTDSPYTYDISVPPTDSDYRGVEQINVGMGTLSIDTGVQYPNTTHIPPIPSPLPEFNVRGLPSFDLSIPVNEEEICIEQITGSSATASSLFSHSGSSSVSTLPSPSPYSAASSLSAVSSPYWPSEYMPAAPIPGYLSSEQHNFTESPYSSEINTVDSIGLTGRGAYQLNEISFDSTSPLSYPPDSPLDMSFPNFPAYPQWRSYPTSPIQELAYQLPLLPANSHPHNFFVSRMSSLQASPNSPAGGYLQQTSPSYITQPMSRIPSGERLLMDFAISGLQSQNVSQNPPSTSSFTNAGYDPKISP